MSHSITHGISSSQVVAKHKLLMSSKPRYSSNFKVKLEALPNQSFEMPSTELNTFLLADPLGLFSDFLWWQQIVR